MLKGCMPSHGHFLSKCQVRRTYAHGYMQALQSFHIPRTASSTLSYGVPLWTVLHRRLQGHGSFFLCEKRILADGREPVPADILQRPGGYPEEMWHGIITARVERKVTYDRGDTQFIGTEHKPYGNSNKPVKRRFA